MNRSTHILIIKYLFYYEEVGDDEFWGRNTILNINLQYMIDIVKSAEIVIISKCNIISEIDDEISRGIENNFISSPTSQIVKELSEKTFNYFLAYSFNKEFLFIKL